MEFITNLNQAVNQFIWGVPAMICILGVGLYLSIGTRFLQIRKFGYAIKTTLGRMFKKKEASDGTMTSFQAVCTALAGTVGTGNIAGVAGAIALGGPGAVFWMWCSALLGMCTKFAEVTLAVHFHERNSKGELVGGPMYYIRNGLGKKWQWLAFAYALFGVLTVFGTGNATQVNTITAAIDSAVQSFYTIPANMLSTVNLVIGIIIAMLVAVVLLGGVKRIGNVAERLVPFMAVLYIIMSLGVVILNINRLPAVFASIIGGAFTPSGFTGGMVGSLFLSMKKGVSRGIFSNEAGLGTGSIAHACADTQEPVKQGLFGIFEVFADTIVICTLTALVILCSGTTIGYGEAAGAELTIAGFTIVYGNWITILTALALCCFAFSTIISWGLYGSRCISFLFSTDKVVKPFLVVYSFVSILGATIDLGLMWDIADTFNGLMAIPNLIGIFLLSGTVFKLTKDYFNNEGAKVK
jgi:alanine or glycine:cation symporter, AGCS family